MNLNTFIKLSICLLNIKLLFSYITVAQRVSKRKKIKSQMRLNFDLYLVLQINEIMKKKPLLF